MTMSQLMSLQSGRTRFLLAGTLITLFILAFSSLKPRASSQRSILPSHQPSTTVNSLQNDVTNATLGFERIFVLNMPDRTDKRDGITLAASVSGMKLDFIDGVQAGSISEKALPIKHEADYKSTWVAAWRAHMNAISRVVHENLTSALIMEDDVDWDVSLKDILLDVAASTNAIAQDHTATEMNIASLHFSEPPQTSPYGDDWDVIWLGHCGTEISDQESRVVMYNDLSVPQPQYLHSWDPKEETPLAIYPNHTRLVGHLTKGVCSLAYGVSQRGARKILYDMGIRYLDMGFDLMLRAFCNGTSGRKKHKCFGVLPPLFEQYRRAGSVAGDSDLADIPDGQRDQGFTMNIRHSVALNMDKILEGETDYRDQFPDT